MTPGQKLVALREQLDLKAVSKEQFVINVRQAILDLQHNITEQEKLKIADEVLKAVARHVIDPFDNDEIGGLRNTVYQDDDAIHYLYESVMIAVFGDQWFEFRRKTYDY